MSAFTEESLQRIMINPCYAITIAPHFIVEHDPAMSEAEWVQTNVSLIRQIGTRQWLRDLLSALEGRDDVADERINPFRAANIDLPFAAEHLPLIEREVWVDINILQLRDMGKERWLWQLLDVLSGAYATAEEVGAEPSPETSFAYGAPGKSRKQQKQRWR